jgi:hypothetical protein
LTGTSWTGAATAAASVDGCGCPGACWACAAGLAASAAKTPTLINQNQRRISHSGRTATRQESHIGAEEGAKERLSRLK